MQAVKTVKAMTKNNGDAEPTNPTAQGSDFERPGTLARDRITSGLNDHDPFGRPGLVHRDKVEKAAPDKGRRDD